MAQLSDVIFRTIASGKGVHLVRGCKESFVYMPGAAPSEGYWFARIRGGHFRKMVRTLRARKVADDAAGGDLKVKAEKGTKTRTKASVKKDTKNGKEAETPEQQRCRALCIC